MNISTSLQTYLSSSEDEMIRFLEKLVLIQSGSRNKAGIDRVASLIENTMASMGFVCEQIKEKELGNHVVARLPHSDPAGKQVLITGHMDTVFPEDTDFNFFKQDETRCYGPGVADMKGGLVVAIYALKALLHNGGSPTPVCFIFNSDEEIGSPGSGRLIREEAKKSRMAFVFEAGGLENEIVTGRKGNLSLRLDIKGEAGHAAFAGSSKASAILELAHKTICIETLNEPKNGISANVGLISGGIGPNTIAEHASARLDFRFLTPEDFSTLEPKIKACCENVTVPGTRSEFSIVSRRPAMPQTESNIQLFEKINAVAKDLGMSVKPELRQGVSDANYIADEGIPVIDGLGPIGAKDHSKDEYIETKSLVDRAVLFAHLLANPALF